MLRIRHNKKRVPLFTDTIISNDLKDIFLSIIEFNKFSEDSYNSLSEQDKILLDDILTKSNIEYNSVLYKHKKYNDNDVSESINQFKILKGEILAGNDNIQLLKDLKKVIFKLMNYNILDRSTVNQLMLDILYSL